MEQNPQQNAIVLADSQWHQGVVGIVASRLAEKFACPAFMICLDQGLGKGSCRSWGGVNLFALLQECAPLLENYGGHALAAGFTVREENIPALTELLQKNVALLSQGQELPSILQVDAVVTPEELTEQGVLALDRLEPCGAGNPRPVFVLNGAQIHSMTQVGRGRHLKMRLESRGNFLDSIFFSADGAQLGLVPGGRIDVAFYPQINEFRGERTVQMNLLDIRPSCSAPCSPEVADYQAMLRGHLTPAVASALLPDRAMLAMVWRYLASVPGPIRENPICLCRKIVRWSGAPLSLGQLLTCLDIFRDVELLQVQRLHKNMTIHLTPGSKKADLTRSRTMQILLQAKEG